MRIFIRADLPIPIVWYHSGRFVVGIRASGDDVVSEGLSVVVDVASCVVGGSFSSSVVAVGVACVVIKESSSVFLVDSVVAKGYVTVDVGAGWSLDVMATIGGTVSSCDVTDDDP